MPNQSKMIAKISESQKKRYDEVAQLRKEWETFKQHVIVDKLETNRKQNEEIAKAVQKLEQRVIQCETHLQKLEAHMINHERFVFQVMTDWKMIRPDETKPNTFHELLSPAMQALVEAKLKEQQQQLPPPTEVPPTPDVKEQMRVEEEAKRVDCAPAPKPEEVP